MGTIWRHGINKKALGLGITLVDNLVNIPGGREEIVIRSSARRGDGGVGDALYGSERFASAGGDVVIRSA
jgi:hypothetical protein